MQNSQPPRKQWVYMYFLLPNLRLEGRSMFGTGALRDLLEGFEAPSGAKRGRVVFG